MAERWGRWSAILIVAIGVLYLVIGATWMLTAGGTARARLQPDEPFLSLLELLILASAPVLVVLTASIHACAPPNGRFRATIALAFMTVFAALTGGVHFVRLTALRQVEAADGTVPDLFHPNRWPSIAAAIDFLAWDFFLGLSLLFAASALPGGRHRLARVVLGASGAACLLGTLGPATGDLQLHLIATAGYAVLLPLSCILLARSFGGSPAQPESQ